MPGNRAQGTFTAAAVSETVKGTDVDYKLAAASGTWSVSLQTKAANGEWVNVGSAITAAAEAAVSRNTEQEWRLNCASLTNTLKNITGITNANPAVVSSTSHGLSNGNVVVIADVPGMTELNGKTFTVANQATNTFELSGVDSRTYGVYGAPVNVTNITKANPAVVTAPGHGLVNGNSVRLAGVVGMTQVNNNTYTVAGATADTFQLSATDSSAYGTYGSPGAITAMTTSGSVVRAISAISKANPGEVTSAAHGFQTGDKVRIERALGMSEVNGVEFTITRTGADTFTIGVNTTGYGTYTANSAVAIRGPVTVVTAASHGFSAGDLVRFADVVGFDDVNANTYTVSLIDTDNFSVQGLDLTHEPTFGGPDAPEIVSVTKANPAVVTTKAAHGFVNGDVVKFTGVVGMTELNSGTYTVANKTDTTFQLSGINSGAYGTYGSPATITGISKANPGVVTAVAHGFSEGHLVHFTSISGMTELNGTYAKVKRITTGAAKVITGISKANPGSVTCTAHGFTNGDVVRLSGIVGMTELNGVDVTITSTGQDTFTIGINTTGYTTYTSGGSAIKLNPDTFALTSSADNSNIDTSGFSTYTADGTATRRGGVVRRNQSGTVLKVAGTASKIAGTASINAIRYDLVGSTDSNKKAVVL